MRPKEWKVSRRYPTGGRALLDSEDIEFDIYKRARELMESSGMKMLPEQEVQAGGLHLWRLRRQANSFSNGFAIREFQCPMRHMYNCNVRLRIVEGPGFMQLERCGLHDKHSHVTATCNTFLGRFPDDALPESSDDSGDEDAQEEEEEEQDADEEEEKEQDADDEDEDEEKADDEDDDSGDGNDAIALPSDGDGINPNLLALY